MFKKFFGLVLIALLAVSSVGFVAAAVDTTDKYLTVYAKTQDNDGDGLIRLYDIDRHFMGEIPIKKGETITIDLKYYFNIDKIEFHSPGRKECYNSNLYGINYYVCGRAWNCLNPNKVDLHPEFFNYHVQVNFYKKSGYYNKIFFETGWYHSGTTPDGDPNRSKVANGEFDHNWAVVRGCKH
ncbi:MAG: hypothetical protein LBD03_08645 [Methanobrevibacter sp.]|jgi:hypothetical protein|nr:hypothetical protein [Candidatus Methanovirga procula]